MVVDEVVRTEHANGFSLSARRGCAHLHRLAPTTYIARYEGTGLSAFCDPIAEAVGQAHRHHGELTLYIDAEDLTAIEDGYRRFWTRFLTRRFGTVECTILFRSRAVSMAVVIAQHVVPGLRATMARAEFERWIAVSVRSAAFEPVAAQ